MFEEVLNSLLRMDNVDVYVTGSNSKFLSSDIVTEFRGRGDEIRIYPLSFAEFYSVYDGEYDDAWNDYMIYGGLPQVAQFRDERQKVEYLKNIFANVYLKYYLQTYCGADDKSIWKSLEIMCSLFIETATWVAAELNYEYNDTEANNGMYFLQSVRNLPKDAREIL